MQGPGLFLPSIAPHPPVEVGYQHLGSLQIVVGQGHEFPIAVNAQLLELAGDRVTDAANVGQFVDRIEWVLVGLRRRAELGELLALQLQLVAEHMTMPLPAPE